MKKLLIVIDAQNDFIDGVLGSEEAQAALPNIHALVNYFVFEDGNEVVYTKDTHFDTASYMDSQEGHNLPIPHCIYNTEGWHIAPEALPDFQSEADVTTLFKTNFGYQGWEDFALNEEYDEIYICGYCTDICVVTNVLALKTAYPETPIYVYKNACAGTTLENHAAALAVMQACQIHVL